MHNKAVSVAGVQAEEGGHPSSHECGAGAAAGPDSWLQHLLR